MTSSSHLNSWTYTVTSDHHGKRLDVWLAEHYQLSRAAAKTAIDLSNLQVGTKPAKPSLVLKTADIISGSLRGVELASSQQWQPTPLSLNIIYEDDAVVVVNKPANLVSHPSSSHHAPTLIEGIMHYLGCANTFTEKTIPSSYPPRFGLIHRLDKDTTGALIIAKHQQAYDHLHHQLHHRTMLREYLTLLDGCLDHSRHICETYLGRSTKNRMRFDAFTREWLTARHPQGIPSRYRYAKSEFRRQVTFAHRFDLCTVKLTTGRTHQIRAHALWLNKPIVGDPTYRGAIQRFRKKSAQTAYQRFLTDINQTPAPLTRQMLHSHALGFVHPTTHKFIHITAPLPQDFRAVLSSLKPYIV